jgi:hypothetical protein
MSLSSRLLVLALSGAAVAACDDAPPLPPAPSDISAEADAIPAEDTATVDTATGDTATGEDVPLAEDATAGPDPDCALTPTLSSLATGYFAAGCAFPGCHGSSPAGGLDLRPDGLHARLVGVSAVDVEAAGRGKKLVVAGDPAASFLLQKVDGSHAADEGDLMPLGADGPVGPGCRVFMLRAWIAAGARDD